MADSAPGQATKSGEASCYNCGGIGHWAIACPEPTRETPAGLLAWRSTSGGASQPKTGDMQPGMKGRGPVVTRYPAPPPSAPVITRYEPPPGYPQPPNPYSAPSHPLPPYPTPPAFHRPSPSYSQHQPPSSHGPYPPYPPHGSPPPLYPPSHGGQYDRPPPHGQQPPYGQQSPYGQPSPYGQQPPYAQPYPSPAYHSAPPPPPPQAYPPRPYPQHNYPPQPYPPPGYPPQTQPPPPPPGSYFPPYSSSAGFGQPPPTGPPPPQYGAQPSYGQQFSPPDPGHGLPRPPHRNSSFKDKNNRNRHDPRGRHDRGGRNQSNHNNRNNRRDSSQPGPRVEFAQASQSTPAEVELKAEGKVDPETGVEAAAEPLSKAEPAPPAIEALPDVKKAASEKAVDDDNGDDDEQDWEWEELMVFKEPEKIHPADEIAKPLPGPIGYHDDVMLPPAWNSKCMQSEFVSDDNIDEYAQPIRDTKFFNDMRFDPAFMKDGVKPLVPSEPKPRSIPLPKQMSKESFTSVTPTGKASLPPKPPATDSSIDRRPATDRKRAWEDSPRPDQKYAPRDRHDAGWRDNRDNRNKRHRRDISPAVSRHRRSTSPRGRLRSRSRSPRDRRAFPEQTYRRDRSFRGGSTEDDPTQTLLRSLDAADGHTRSRPRSPLPRYREWSPAPGTNRQDSGYSSWPMERHSSSGSRIERPLTPLPPAGTPPRESGPQSRRSSWHSHPGSRRGSHASSRPASRPVSRQSVGSCNSYASDSSLDEVEAGLLGLPFKPKSSKDTDGTNRHGDGDTKLRRRQPRVDSAYSRRW